MSEAPEDLASEHAGSRSSSSLSSKPVFVIVNEQQQPPKPRSEHRAPDLAAASLSKQTGPAADRRRDCNHFSRQKARSASLHHQQPDGVQVKRLFVQLNHHHNGPFVFRDQEEDAIEATPSFEANQLSDRQPFVYKDSREASSPATSISKRLERRTAATSTVRQHPFSSSIVCGIRVCTKPLDRRQAERAADSVIVKITLLEAGERSVRGVRCAWAVTRLYNSTVVPAEYTVYVQHAIPYRLPLSSAVLQQEEIRRPSSTCRKS